MRPDDNSHWKRADRHVSLVLLAVMLTIMARRWFSGPGLLAPDYLFWTAAVLAGLSAWEWKALAHRSRGPVSDTLLIACGSLALILVVFLRGPADFVFVLATFPLLYMRLPLRLALGLGAALLAVSVAIVLVRWSPDAVTLTRMIVPGVMVLALLHVFASAARRTLADTRQAQGLLDSSLSAMAQGFLVIGADGRLKVHNEQMRAMLDLPEALLRRRPHIGEVARFQRERGDFGTDYADVEEAVRPYMRQDGRGGEQEFPRTYRRRTPQGRVLEIHTLPLPTGDTMRTYTDVTDYVLVNQQLEAVLKDFNQLRQRELARSREQMVDALSELSRFRDHETGQHILRTKLFVRTLAEALVRAGHYADELPPERIDLIVKAAPMHDLGKVGVPDHILLKPGRHSPEESALMRAHASIGESTLLIAARDSGSQRSVLTVAARIAGGHHENWDGSGYPRGLMGESIPLEARLMALADVYDAVTTSRPYKRPWSHEEAIAEVARLAGVKFDPKVAAAFAREHETFRRIGETYRDESEPSPA